MGCVYALVDPRTGEPRYVGITTRTLERRLSGHWRSRNSEETHKTHWLRILAKLGLRPRIVSLAEVPANGLAVLEMFWIAELVRRGFSLTNSTAGGSIAGGMTPEVAQKIGNANRGKLCKKETRDKMSAAKRGVAKSPAHRAALAVALKKARAAQVPGAGRIGKKHSLEAKAKIGAATRARAAARNVT